MASRQVRNLINKENFLSNVISINIDGKEQQVLPREITYDIITKHIII